MPTHTAPTLVDQIEDRLPQTQCTKCGYPACRTYAEAIANGTAEINQCPPGGMEGVTRLAHLLNRPIIPINPANGVERPRPVAFIDESLCIGCTLCIQACPVDAIIGAAKHMHTIIPELCTGCDLCVAPCPVDCINMIPVTGTQTGWAAWSPAQADNARARHDFLILRRQREQAENNTRLEAKAREKLKTVHSETPHTDAERIEQDRKKKIIQDALARLNLKKNP